MKQKMKLLKPAVVKMCLKFCHKSREESVRVKAATGMVGLLEQGKDSPSHLRATPCQLTHTTEIIRLVISKTSKKVLKIKVMLM